MDRINSHASDRSYEDTINVKTADECFNFICRPFFNTLKQMQEETEKRVNELEKNINKILPSIDQLNTHFNQIINGTGSSPPMDLRLDRIERAISDLIEQMRITDPAKRLDVLEHIVDSIQIRKEKDEELHIQMRTTIYTRLITAALIGIGGFIVSAILFWMQHK